MTETRNRHSDLSRSEWQNLRQAIAGAMAPGAASPTYQDLVDVHLTAMTGPEAHEWGVHSMPGMLGRNFLAWHRHYLLVFERRLRQEVATVTLPYWDWLADSKIPRALSGEERLAEWGVRREWNKDFMPARGDVNAAFRRERFEPFQRVLEQVHNNVHLAVGGEMATAESPADPIFWLHHANVDRLWARWQERHPRRRAANPDERLEPPPLFGVPVGEVWKLSDLDYEYA